MNFNISHKVDYDLQGRHTHELINLYGISTKLILTEKLQYDENVFGDFQSIKVNKENIFALNMMPENSEEFDDIGVNFSEFGMMNVENIRLFVSRKSLDAIFEEVDDKDNTVDVNSPIKKLQSNLVILPNNRIMEITDVQFMVPGINNLFTNNDIKHVYKLTLKTYDKKLTDNIEAINDEEFNDKNTDPDLVGSYKELDEYFSELTNNEIKVDKESTEDVNISNNPVIGTPVKKINHPIQEEDSVFGRF